MAPALPSPEHPWRPRPGRALAGLLLAQAALFLALPMLGSAHSWAVLSPLPAEIAADLLSGHESPWDGYDGIAAGPLGSALLQAPWLALLGRIGLVQVLGSLLVALGATAASWLCARELLGPRAALVVAALVAFPAPTTWVNQHYGAYHAIPLLTAPLGYWLLLRARGLRGRVLGVAVLGSSVAWSLGSIAVVAPLVAGWWWPHRRGRDGWSAAAAVALGGLLAASPLLFKVFVHVPYDGLLAGVDVASATKPFFLGAPSLLEVPGALGRMLTRSLPYGHHFGLHGLPALDPVMAALTVGAWVIAARDGRLGPWLLVPPSVLIVGLVTGWFVFDPAGQVPFERDARHVIGLLHGLAMAVGAAWLALDSAPSRVPRAALSAAVALFVVGSAATQVRAAQVAWDEGGRPDLATPFRLEGRYISGFFRGPHFLTAPDRAIASCDALPSPSSRDCLRGVAMAFGLASDDLVAARELCAPLGAELQPWCSFGRGWGEAQRRWRRPDQASAACDGPGATPEEIRDCRAGVGWAAAQDFADRPFVVAMWAAELPAAERRPFVAGVGVYAGMLSADPAHVARVCARLVPESLHARCILGAAQNAPFMAPAN